MTENYLTPKLYKEFSYLLSFKSDWQSTKITLESAFQIMPRKHWQFVFDICYYGACRINEALNLQVSEIDWNEKKIILPSSRTKTKTPRVVTIGNDAFWQSFGEMTMPVEGYVFAARANRRSLYRYAYEMTREICKDIDDLSIRHVSKKKVRTEGYTHLFRKSCGTHMLRSGFQLDDIREKLGHTNIMMTSRYLTGMGDQNREEKEREIFN